MILEAISTGDVTRGCHVDYAMVYAYGRIIKALIRKKSGTVFAF